MEVSRYSINGTKVGVENSEFTKATSAFAPNTNWNINDPVIQK